MGVTALAGHLWPVGAAASPGVTGAVSQLFLAGLVGGVGLWLVFAVVTWSGRRGWVVLTILAAFVIFGAVLVTPLTLLPATRGDVAANGPAAASILRFAEKGGLDAKILYVFKGGNPVDVDMEGAGPFAHAAVSRAALAAPTPEAYAAIGHLLGHYRHRDLWSLSLLWSGFAAAFFWAASTVRRGVALRAERAASASVVVARALPLVGLIAWSLMLFGTPIFNIFDQWINYRADDYALTQTNDPDALCRWLLAAEVHGKADPSALESILFFDHPPLKARLVKAMAWKARREAAARPGL